MKGIINYKLHKDSSYIGQGFNTFSDFNKRIKELRKYKYIIDDILFLTNICKRQK